MYEQVEKPKVNKNKAVANSVTQKKSNVKQGLGLVDNRLKAKQATQLQNMIDSRTVQHHDPIQKREVSSFSNRIVQLAKTATIGAWCGQLTAANANWDKRLDRGGGVTPANKIRNEKIIKGALSAHGKPSSADDVVDFAISNTVEISSAYITASNRKIGEVYKPDNAIILGLTDIKQVIKGAGAARSAPKANALHHHDGNNLNINIIYQNTGNGVQVLGIYYHHMDKKHMSDKKNQAAVTAIESRTGLWDKVIELGDNDVVDFPW